MIKTHRTLIGSIALALTISFSAGASAGPKLKMPDGRQIEASELPYFKSRPKVFGYLEKIVNSGRQNEMAFAIAPPFCPSYSYTSWGGVEPVTRAAGSCQTRVDKLLDDHDWPTSLRAGCKCVLAIQNMEILDPIPLMRPTRFASGQLLIKAGSDQVIRRSGVLEYEKGELIQQAFSLFNEKKDRICHGRLEFKVGELGKFSGTCLGNNKIVDGGVSVFCPTGIFCKRLMVGNMRRSNGYLIGFTSGINEADRKEKYPDLPEKFEVEAAPEIQEEEVND